VQVGALVEISRARDLRGVVGGLATVVEEVGVLLGDDAAGRDVKDPGYDLAHGVLRSAVAGEVLG
jgi:hypothetical protein